MMDPERPEVVDDSKATAVLREAVPGLVVVYRFGSSVSGGHLPGSDLDYAFLSREPLDPVVRWEVEQRLAQELRGPVDLVDLRRAPTVMRMQVLSGGVLLLDLDEDERTRFEIHVYSSYARLNEERRGILDGIERDGSVYGR